MPMYVADFSYKEEAWGSVTLEADDDNQADDYVMEHIREAYPEALDITVETLKVI